MINNSSEIKTAQKVINSAIDGLKALSSCLDDKFDNLINEIINHKGRIIVSGMGKSGHIARKIAATLSSTGTTSFFIHPGEASHGDLGMIQPDDMVLLLSNSGETEELKDIINYCKRFHIFLISMVRKENSTLGLSSDICLLLPAIPEALEFDAPTTSTTMMLALGDAIALTLLDRKGFSRKDFQTYHPGGRLGASFFRVKDIMHVDYALPIVHLDDKVSTAIEVMSQKRFGCTAVLDQEQRLVGVFTDGELRRNIASIDLLNKNISEVMKANPLIITAQSLVVEALEIMNRKLITVLFVVDDNQHLRGLVHMHDCLKVGASPELK
ncbi:MAG: KpsF/GutQ family sugar-phosphate isomerase [Rickettsiales bacterium]|jgi:arabinose-5-phosphate isomerase|nr:KpsF/GutQ family sugar-phosphate isomerase [Rickettsiales bacterium]